MSALLGVMVFIVLMGLYVREFQFFSNTIDVQWLIVRSLLLAFVLAAGVVWRYRARFSPWERHLPEALFILILGPLFAPLAASLLNRSTSAYAYQSFEFIAERPYYASNFGLLKGEKPSPLGYFLTVREHDKGYRFRYKKQVYFPLTQPGDTIMLPIKKGLLGFRVMLLK